MIYEYKNKLYVSHILTSDIATAGWFQIAIEWMENTL